MLSRPRSPSSCGPACGRGSSIVFAGAPGSGKTTMLSCCAAELDPSLRVVIAEEVFEADVPLAERRAACRPGRARPDRPAVDLRRLVAGFLRMAPDVAIVGEVRDREALPLLLTLSSGVKGFTTIHAGSARQALTRLRFICQLADTPRAPAVGAQHPRHRGDRRRRALRADAGRAAGHRDRSPSRTWPAAPDATQFTVTEVFRRAGVDEPARPGPATCRCAPRGRSDERGLRRPDAARAPAQTRRPSARAAASA